jgi:hypothetical protein
MPEYFISLSRRDVLAQACTSEVIFLQEEHPIRNNHIMAWERIPQTVRNANCRLKTIQEIDTPTWIISV